MLYPDAKLILFSRAPEAGKVKTRLIPALGKQGAAELQQRMSRHIIDLVFQAQFTNIEIQCQPDSKHDFFTHLLNDYCVELNAQNGDDLGQKMAHAMQQALSQHNYAIIIGTDAPALSKEYIRQAFEQLRSGIDVVLGPAEDGGYVLIGCSSFKAEIFKNISWSTEHVYKQTLKRIIDCDMTYHELDMQWDVDRPQDLYRLKNDPALSFLLNDLEITDNSLKPFEHF